MPSTSTIASQDPTTMLTPQQLQVIALLNQGEAITAAAKACGLHRTTIHHWRRTDPAFALALHDAQADAAEHWRQATQARADRALEALDTLLADPRTPAGIRLKAILHILNTASNACPAAAAIAYENQLLAQHQREQERATNAVVRQCVANAEAAMNVTVEDLRAMGVLDDSPDGETPAPEATRRPHPIHHHSSPFDATPKVGRNAPCPCRSGRKFKQCCLGRRPAQAAA